jgi:hypothetical protein
MRFDGDAVANSLLGEETTVRRIEESNRRLTGNACRRDREYRRNADEDRQGKIPNLRVCNNHVLQLESRAIVSPDEPTAINSRD